MVTVNSDTIEEAAEAYKEITGHGTTAEEIMEIAMELEAIVKALTHSIRSTDYIRMREDSKHPTEDGYAYDIIKISFSVTVDIKGKYVEATSKGSIKLQGTAGAYIQDPAQGEFDFEEGGEA